MLTDSTRHRRLFFGVGGEGGTRWKSGQIPQKIIPALDSQREKVFNETGQTDLSPGDNRNSSKKLGREKEVGLKNGLHACTLLQ